MPSTVLSTLWALSQAGLSAMGQEGKQFMPESLRVGLPHRETLIQIQGLLKKQKAYEATRD